MNKYTSKILTALEVPEKLQSSIPTLEWKDSFLKGGTGYIDGVIRLDMVAPIMVGVDPKGREFVAVRGTQIHDDSINLGSGVWFQRYSYNQSEWAFGSHDGLKGFCSHVHPSNGMYYEVWSWRQQVMIK